MKRSPIITFAIVLAILFTVAIPAWAADDIKGIWKIIDDKTNKPTAYVLLYTYNGMLYGRMVATIDKDTGKIDDTLLEKKKKATALAGEPPNCGLDFVYELSDKGKEWKGAIIDPKDGKVYDCTIKPESTKLSVRGSLRGTGGLLGRNQTWLKASASDLPKEMSLDPSAYKPVIPTKK